MTAPMTAKPDRTPLTRVDAVRPAGLGQRSAAALVDIVILGALFVVLAATMGDTSSGDGTVSANLNGLPALLFFVAVLAYYAGLEAAFGRTLGKLALGLRVVQEDGSKLTGGGSIIRNLLRVVDGLPFLYLVGFVCALATGRERRARIGDLAAKTVVTAG